MSADNIKMDVDSDININVGDLSMVEDYKIETDLKERLDAFTKEYIHTYCKTEEDIKNLGKNKDFHSRVKRIVELDVRYFYKKREEWEKKFKRGLLSGMPNSEMYKLMKKHPSIVNFFEGLDDEY